MTLGEKIYALRSDHKMSQGDLADKLNVSRQSISKWETGQSIPEMDKISAMSDLFGVSTDYLIKEDATQRTIMLEAINVNQKVFIQDANKRKLAAFDEFAIEMIAFANGGHTERVPVCLICGIKKGLLGMNKRMVLGYYAALQDAQQELKDIANASGRSSTYELKYAVKMKGVRIAED